MPCVSRVFSLGVEESVEIVGYVWIWIASRHSEESWEEGKIPWVTPRCIENICRGL
jgi:hypothetical protein